MISKTYIPIVLIIIILIGTELMSSQRNDKSLEFDKDYKIIEEKLITTYEVTLQTNEIQGNEFKKMKESLQEKFNGISRPTELQIFENEYVICSVATYLEQYTKSDCEYNIPQTTTLTEREENRMKRMELYRSMKIFKSERYKSLKKEEKKEFLANLQVQLESSQLYYENKGLLDSKYREYPVEYFNNYQFHFLETTVTSSVLRSDRRFYERDRGKYYDLLFNISDEFYMIGEYSSSEKILGKIYTKTSGYLEELNSRFMRLALVEIENFHKLKTRESFETVIVLLSYGVTPYYYNEEFTNLMGREVKVYFEYVRKTSDYNLSDFENILKHILLSKYTTRMANKKILTDTEDSLDYIEKIINNIGYDLMSQGKLKDAVSILKLNYRYNPHEYYTEKNLIEIGNSYYFQGKYDESCRIFSSLSSLGGEETSKIIKNTYDYLLTVSNVAYCKELPEELVPELPLEVLNY